MKVLYVSHSAALSGAETALLRLLAHLDRQQVEPLVALPEDGPLRQRLEELGIRTRVLPLSWWIPATHWRAPQYLAQLEGLEERAEALAALAADERVELVHTNTLVTLEGALAAARLGVPHVWHSRGLFGQGSPPPYHDDRRFFLSVVDRLADEVICVSRAVAEQTAEVCRRAPSSVIFDGFDAASFLARPVGSREDFARRLGLAGTARVVLCVGGIQRRKGQLDLIEAAARLTGEFPDLVVALCGAEADAEYAAALDGRIAELDLARHVRQPGFEPDVRSLLAHAEMLVQPSHSEGFGLAVLEAMAAGRPVVATRCGGPEEIVEDGVSGLLVPVGDPAALAGAVRRLLADPAEAAALGRAAAARAGDFSLEATARRTAAVYRRRLAAPRPGAERARAAGLAAQEVLARGRATVLTSDLTPAPPPPPRSPRPGSWLARLRGRSG
ncbi:MAG TPA: glycosyltransferase family 4 protein [Thermoanaerobaculia bacterium]|nr:glycosyltransferase family 4 protein [Thermoanaerobaculia bacterium]